MGPEQKDLPSSKETSKKDPPELRKGSGLSKFKIKVGNVCYWEKQENLGSTTVLREGGNIRQTERYINRGVLTSWFLSFQSLSQMRDVGSTDKYREICFISGVFPYTCRDP